MAEPGVVAGGDDCPVALTVRPSGSEDEVGDGGELKLHHPGPRASHRLDHGLGGEPTGDSQEVKLGVALHEANSVEQRRQVGEGDLREAIHQQPNKAGLLVGQASQGSEAAIAVARSSWSRIPRAPSAGCNGV